MASSSPFAKHETDDYEYPICMFSFTEDDPNPGDGGFVTISASASKLCGVTEIIRSNINEDIEAIRQEIENSYQFKNSDHEQKVKPSELIKTVSCPGFKESVRSVHDATMSLRIELPHDISTLVIQFCGAPIYVGVGIETEYLVLIEEYLVHHNGVKPAEIAKPVRSVKMEKIVEDPWDAEYIGKCSKRIVFQLILAANSLFINSLLHLGCAKIATLIKGKSPDEIRQILSDDSDERPDEQETQDENDDEDEDEDENKDVDRDGVDENMLDAYGHDLGTEPQTLVRRYSASDLDFRALDQDDS